MSTGKQPRQYNLLYFQHWAGGAFVLAVNFFLLPRSLAKERQEEEGKEGQLCHG